jgi:hypothetical protein
MRQGARRLWTKVEVQVEHGRAPLVRGHPLAHERRQDSGRGDGFEELTAIHDWPSVRRQQVFDQAG